MGKDESIMDIEGKVNASSDEKVDNKNKKVISEEEELTDEEIELRDGLLLKAKLSGSTDVATRIAAIEGLHTALKAATVTLASVPKEVQYLYRTFPNLVLIHEKMSTEDEGYAKFSALLSFLAVTSSTVLSDVEDEEERKLAAEREARLAKDKDMTEKEKEEARTEEALKAAKAKNKPKKPSLLLPEEEAEEMKDIRRRPLQALKFRITAGGETEEIQSWGIDYMRHISKELLIKVREARGDKEVDLSAKEDAAVPSELNTIISTVFAAFMKSNSYDEAIDLVLEAGHMHLLPPLVTKASVTKICTYLVASARISSEAHCSYLLNMAFELFVEHKKIVAALVLSIEMEKMDQALCLFTKALDGGMRLQMCHTLSHFKKFVDLETVEGIPEDEKARLQSVVNNEHLPDQVKSAMKHLAVETKLPHDAFKSHKADGRGLAPSKKETHIQGLGEAVVNGLVNTGLGGDKLASEDENNKWLYKCKGDDRIAAVASLGMHYLWDFDNGLTALDKWMYSEDADVRSGAHLAIGVMSTGCVNDCDPAFALLTTALDNENLTDNEMISCIAGLGIAYSGQRREDVSELLMKYMGSDITLKVAATASLALGMVNCGIGVGEASDTLLMTILDRGLDYDPESASKPEEDLDEEEKKKRKAEALAEHSSNPLLLPSGMLFCAGLALMCYGHASALEGIMAALDALPEEVTEIYAMVIEAISHTGSGEPELIQKFSKIAGDHETKGYVCQMAALCCGFISMGNPLARDMTSRFADHFVQYLVREKTTPRCGVAVAMGLLHVSHPKIDIEESLGRLAHDHDKDVCRSAILSLGLMAAGTNNSRVSATLRGLAAFHYTRPSILHCIRIAIGLVHMGQGLLTLSEPHNRLPGDHYHVSPSALAALLPFSFACLRPDTYLVMEYSWMPVILASAASPRWIFTVDEENNPLETEVRVGQALELVGQVGHTQAITAFQTMNTPAIVAAGQRATMSGDKYTCHVPLMSNGTTVVKKNPLSESS